MPMFKFIIVSANMCFATGLGVFLSWGQKTNEVPDFSEVQITINITKKNNEYVNLAQMKVKSCIS